MGALQIIAICTGAVEFFYILLSKLTGKKVDWNDFTLLASLATYNFLFLSEIGGVVINALLSFAISFLFLEYNYSKLGIAEDKRWKKFIWISAFTCIGYLITFSLSSYGNATILLTPFLLIQNFLIFSFIHTVNQKENITSEQVALYFNIIGVALLSGFFLLSNKVLANYLVTNGFFVLIVLQPFLPELFQNKDVQKHESLDSLFEMWKFTPTEKEIGMLLIKGKSTADIAAIKFIEEGTVRKHISNLMNKASVSQRHEFVAKVELTMNYTDQ